MGLGADAINDRKVLEGVMEELKAISGQQPVKTTARKSVASFKLREGFAIGCKVTLRGERMYEFLDRLLSIAILEREILEVWILNLLMVEETTR